MAFEIFMQVASLIFKGKWKMSFNIIYEHITCNIALWNINFALLWYNNSPMQLDFSAPKRPPWQTSKHELTWKPFLMELADGLVDQDTKLCNRVQHWHAISQQLTQPFAAQWSPTKRKLCMGIPASFLEKIFSSSFGIWRIYVMKLITLRTFQISLIFLDNLWCKFCCTWHFVHVWLW